MQNVATKHISHLSVTGMTCNNCARHVTEAIQSVPGVHSAQVSLETKRAAVRWAADAEPDVSAVVQAVQRAGFPAKAVDSIAPGPGAAKFSSWQSNVWIGIFGTAPLMAGEWIFHLAPRPWFQWLSFALASVVQILAGAPFYRGAWNQLRARGSNMDTLVALGSTTAFVFSAWTLLTGHGGHVYFMEAASIITLISLGHWMESRVSLRASNALRELLQLAPQTARRLQSTAPAEKKNFSPLDLRSFNPVAAAQKTEVEVPVSELRAGDRVVLRPGDLVPVDGEVTEGASSVDESMLTGESMPVEKSAGAKVFAGTTNQNGRLVMRVTATGEETALAHIIATVQRAQTSRAEIQRIGDRVSNVFVPVVVTIALGAALGWGLAPESAKNAHAMLAQFVPWHAHTFESPLAAAFIVAASVLIIACPCAMGLATPAAIMAGANAAVRRGILIRDGVALEKAGKISAVIFDKTGTLTFGELAVLGPWTPDGSEQSVLRAKEIAGALARPSNHPVSKVLAWFAGGKVELGDWREVPGSGVQAGLHSQNGELETVRLGALNWLQGCGVEIPQNEPALEKWNTEGATLVGLSKSDGLIGVFALRDCLKDNSPKVVRHLQNQGLKTFLLTGDNPQTAVAMAKEAGIAAENVFANVRPEQKSEFVKTLQQRGERVAFVGDGINDAPALEQADLGIAVSRANDVACAAADIVLLKTDIEVVPEALGLARATLRTIKQNLFWAFFYNALGIPLAALGFMSPILCAAAMGFSDLIVIGNALRLARWRWRHGA